MLIGLKVSLAPLTECNVKPSFDQIVVPEGLHEADIYIQPCFLHRCHSIAQWQSPAPRVAWLAVELYVSLTPHAQMVKTAFSLAPRNIKT